MPRIVVLGKQVDRPSQERPPRIEIAAVECTAPRPAEMLRGAAGDSLERRIGAVELQPVSMRLLEVVADDLIALDELVRRQPVREALVELGARRLGERFIRRIAYQQVTEAKALVLGEGGRRRADELLANECREV
jgi:hypothetical protein